MGLVWIREQWSKRTGSGDEKAVREYMRSWLILRDSMLDDAHAVLTTPGLPNLFQIYVGADGNADPLAALCRKLEARQPDADQPFLWEVTAHYSNHTDQPELGDPNPLTRPSEIEWGWVQSQRILTQTIDGKAVVNSSGELFDPPVEVDDGRIKLTITRNESSFDPNLAIKYKDAVNSDSFLGASPGLAKLMPISAKRHFENNIFYYQVTYEIHFRGVKDPPWQPTVLDAGYHHLDANGKPTKNLDKSNGTPLQSPAQLVGGQLLTDAATTLFAAMDGVQKQLTVTTDALWPSSYPFTIQIGTEQLTVTSRIAAGNYNCTRAANNTAAASHANGSAVTLGPQYLTFQAYNALPFGTLSLP